MDEKIKKTEEELKEIRKSNAKIANNYSKKKGYSNIKELQKEAKEMYDNPETRIAAKAMMEETITDLTKLVLYQEIYETSLSKVYGLVDKVNDGYIEYGNAKEYIVDLITGTEVFNATNFVPSKQSIKKLEKYTIQMYDAGGTLNKRAYQFKKSHTLMEPEYIPYFLSGKLNDYLTKIRNQLYKAYKIFISNKLFDLMTKEAPNKVIVGKATNMFDALVDEVLPEIDKMLELNSEYNYVESKYLDTSNIDDIYIIMSTKNRSRIKNGILTQLFNANLLGPEGKTMKSSNVISLGNKITLNDADNIIVDSKNQWVDDNTILVFDMSKIKSIMQVNSIGSQRFENNMTTLIVSHMWGAIDILPWCKCFKYTNSNLSKLTE